MQRCSPPGGLAVREAQCSSQPPMIHPEEEEGNQVSPPAAAAGVGRLCRNTPAPAQGVGVGRSEAIMHISLPLSLQGLPAFRSRAGAS